MKVRRWAIGGLGAVTAVLVAGAAAWACVSGPAVNLSTVNAKPGQEVNVTGTNFSKKDPVTVRWNALDGPVLATMAAPDSNNTISGKITVPGDAKAGNYVLIFTQSSSDGKLSQMPVRALLTVTPDGGSQPVVGAPVAAQQAGRADSLVTTDNDVSGATLALIALGVAGLGMFVAGMAALFAGRRARQPETAKVRS
ncbi:MAG: hypothetical protein ACRD12_07300 [Acidimicrobiales bacterium]